MADGGWLAVAGVAVGGVLTGSVALFQHRSQQRSEVRRAQDEHRWNDETALREREHAEGFRRRQELLDLYTRYQLAADRFENAVRALAPTGDASSVERFEAAQNEYDHATELIRLLASASTVQLSLEQRRLFNGLAADALDDCYDDSDARRSIAAATEPLLAAMRQDLGTAE